MVKDLIPKPKPRQAWPLCWTTGSPWRLGRGGGREQGSLTRTLNREEDEDLPFLVSFVIICAGGQEADGSTEAVFAWALAEGGGPGSSGVARVAGRAGRFGGKADVFAGGVSTSSSADGSPS